MARGVRRGSRHRACASFGDVAGRSHASAGGMGEILPVDVFIPDCRPRPEAPLRDPGRGRAPAGAALTAGPAPRQGSRARHALRDHRSPVTFSSTGRNATAFTSMCSTMGARTPPLAIRAQPRTAAMSTRSGSLRPYLGSPALGDLDSDPGERPIRGAEQILRGHSGQRVGRAVAHRTWPAALTRSQDAG